MKKIKKNVLITGSNRGIGKAILECYNNKDYVIFKPLNFFFLLVCKFLYTQGNFHFFKKNFQSFSIVNKTFLYDCFK